MIGRRSIWVDTEVQGLAKRFVCAADEVGRLQKKGGPECDFFRGFSELGHYGGRTEPTRTRQGIYCVAPSGAFLASVNTSDPRRVVRMLREALAAWEAMPEERRLRPRAASRYAGARLRVEDHYPEDGLVLNVVVRDLPREASGADRWAKAWNQDYAWFRKWEARRLLPVELKVGAQRAIPGTYLVRFARAHLVDTVRGQSPAYPQGAVKTLRLRSEVTAVDGMLVSVRLRGEVVLTQDGRWAVRGYRDMHEPTAQERGFDAQLLGYARFDTDKERFVMFELLAVGSRWGATQYNGRADDPGPAPMGILFRLAGTSPRERVAPAHFRVYGW